MEFTFFLLLFDKSKLPVNWIAFKPPKNVLFNVQQKIFYSKMFVLFIHKVYSARPTYLYWLSTILQVFGKIFVLCKKSNFLLCRKYYFCWAVQFFLVNTFKHASVQTLAYLATSPIFSFLLYFLSFRHILTGFDTLFNILTHFLMFWQPFLIFWLNFAYFETLPKVLTHSFWFWHWFLSYFCPLSQLFETLSQNLLYFISFSSL